MRLFKMKTRLMVDKSFSQHMIYQVFRAITHDIFNDKTWFPTSRCSCEDVFYEVFCIVDKMMFSHTDTESRLAFVEGIGQYEKNYVDEDGYATAQEERQRIVFVILYMAAVILQMMPLESKVFQFCSMIMGQWRGYVTQEFSQRCLGAVVKNHEVVERLAASIGYYGEDGFFVSSQINELMRQNNDEDYLHGFEPEPQKALELIVIDNKHQKNGEQEKAEEDNEKEWGDLSQEERVKRALQKMIDEKAIFRKKDYALIMAVLSDIKDFEGKFGHGASFCEYLTEQLGLPSDLTNANVISKRFSQMHGTYPNWFFDDVSDPNARQKLINIANRFVAIYRKGQ